MSVPRKKFSKAAPKRGTRKLKLKRIVLLCLFLFITFLVGSIIKDIVDDKQEVKILIKREQQAQKQIKTLKLQNEALQKEVETLKNINLYILEQDVSTNEAVIPQEYVWNDAPLVETTENVEAPGMGTILPGVLVGAMDLVRQVFFRGPITAN